MKGIMHVGRLTPRSEVLFLAVSLLILINTLACCVSSRQSPKEHAAGLKPGDIRMVTIPASKFTIELAYIPEGTFVMGSPEGEKGREPAEGPQRTVRVNAFWMANKEITKELYYYWCVEDFRLVQNWIYGHRDGVPVTEAMLKANQVPRSYGGFFMGPPHPKIISFDPNFPVTVETQYAAQMFCQWLSIRTGRPFRLPTEAEWEYAARAGSRKAYFWGNDPRKLGEYAWHSESWEEGGMHPVGLKKPNPWGLYDMYGNVGEWVLDGWASQYPNSIQNNPWVRRLSGSRIGVVRGGDWTCTPNEMRSASRRQQDDTASRGLFDPSPWWDSMNPEAFLVGFRVVSPVEVEEDGRESSIEPWRTETTDVHTNQIQEAAFQKFKQRELRIKGISK